jgi:hypothetical protein
MRPAPGRRVVLGCAGWLARVLAGWRAAVGELGFPDGSATVGAAPRFRWLWPCCRAARCRARRRRRPLFAAPPASSRSPRLTSQGRGEAAVRVLPQYGYLPEAGWRDCPRRYRKAARRPAELLLRTSGAGDRAWLALGAAGVRCRPIAQLWPCSRWPTRQVTPVQTGGLARPTVVAPWPLHVRQRADPALTPAQPVRVVAKDVLDRASDSNDGVAGTCPR